MSVSDGTYSLPGASVLKSIVCACHRSRQQSRSPNSQTLRGTEYLGSGSKAYAGGRSAGAVRPCFRFAFHVFLLRSCVQKSTECVLSKRCHHFLSIATLVPISPNHANLVKSNSVFLSKPCPRDSSLTKFAQSWRWNPGFNVTVRRLSSSMWEPDVRAFNAVAQLTHGSTCQERSNSRCIIWEAVRSLSASVLGVCVLAGRQGVASFQSSMKCPLCWFR